MARARSRRPSKPKPPPVQKIEPVVVKPSVFGLIRCWKCWQLVGYGVERGPNWKEPTTCNLCGTDLCERLESEEYA